ncbi:hypothetical protein PFDG_02959 [Plasmodium falciparum Dd2]|uniref:C3H1-type domain-containing protein n=1 Tax=Plasmodium falciparum (isolate Dd2) TaxID=57267 RepID=A0A0L7M2D6_PLAF4|nr:hypothetical protein PFDG_02959 [Plasmodium falciparum Dd2]
MMMKNGSNNQSSVAVAQIPRKKQFYKTKMCPWFFSGRCDRGMECLFAHSQGELNPIPDLSFTSLCPLTKKSGLCKNEKCSYAHSVCELRPTGDLYKTAPCTKFLRGKCNAEEHCRHAHFVEELRPLPGNLAPSQSAINLMLSSSINNPIQKGTRKITITTTIKIITTITVIIIITITITIIITLGRIRKMKRYEEIDCLSESYPSSVI